MRGKTLLVLIAAVSMTGCSTQRSQSLVHQQRVDVVPAIVDQSSTSLHAGAIQLGASDMYGDVVYAHYLAYRDRQSEMHAEALSGRESH